MSPSNFGIHSDTGMSSSSSSGKLTIVQPQHKHVVSFDWSDFLGASANAQPSLYVDDDGYDHPLDTTACSVSLPPTSISQAPCFASPCEKVDMPATVLSRSPNSVLDFHRPAAQALPTLTVPFRNLSRIKFADKVSVRIHNVVASDHPCCKAGLALELGWDYNEATEDLREHSNPKNTRVYRSSLAERRRVLLDIAGYTNHQLDEIAQQQIIETKAKAQPHTLWSSTCEQRYQNHQRQRRAVREARTNKSSPQHAKLSFAE